MIIYPKQYPLTKLHFLQFDLVFNHAPTLFYFFCSHLIDSGIDMQCLIDPCIHLFIYPWRNSDFLRIFGPYFIYYWFQRNGCCSAIARSVGFIHGLQKSDYIMTNYIIASCVSLLPSGKILHNLLPIFITRIGFASNFLLLRSLQQLWCKL